MLALNQGKIPALPRAPLLARLLRASAGPDSAEARHRPMVWQIIDPSLTLASETEVSDRAAWLSQGEARDAFSLLSYNPRTSQVGAKFRHAPRAL